MRIDIERGNGRLGLSLLSFCRTKKPDKSVPNRKLEIHIDSNLFRRAIPPNTTCNEVTGNKLSHPKLRFLETVQCVSEDWLNCSVTSLRNEIFKVLTSVLDGYRDKHGRYTSVHHYSRS
jgi:hypothetical protein